MRFFSTVVTCLLSISAVWSLPMPSEYGEDYKQLLVTSVNDYNSNHGLPAVTIAPCLNNAAYEYNLKLSLGTGSASATDASALPYQISNGQCDSNISANGNVITLHVSSDTNESILELSDRIARAEAVKTYNYIGVDKVLSPDSKQYWTVVLA
ncbi:hypothetical protein BDF22DRAFT_65845 [Syncephalis plumigaleata]|nr:hypothetical protein BDF22DRAFT_65845 [Syncephalis plumigaleata]